MLSTIHNEGQNTATSDDYSCTDENINNPAIAKTWRFAQKFGLSSSALDELLLLVRNLSSQEMLKHTRNLPLSSTWLSKTALNRGKQPSSTEEARLPSAIEFLKIREVSKNKFHTT